MDNFRKKSETSFRERSHATHKRRGHPGRSSKCWLRSSLNTHRCLQPPRSLRRWLAFFFFCRLVFSWALPVQRLSRVTRPLLFARSHCRQRVTRAFACTLLSAAAAITGAMEGGEKKVADIPIPPSPSPSTNNPPCRLRPSPFVLQNKPYPFSKQPSKEKTPRFYYMLPHTHPWLSMTSRNMAFTSGSGGRGAIDMGS